MRHLLASAFVPLLVLPLGAQEGGAKIDDKPVKEWVAMVAGEGDGAVSADYLEQVSQRTAPPSRN